MQVNIQLKQRKLSKCHFKEEEELELQCGHEIEAVCRKLKRSLFVWFVL